jgi:hypothetical protein
MITTINSSLMVEVVQLPERGSTLEVRVYKKVLGFKKRVSSDWFLNEQQARTYAAELVKNLASDSSLEFIRKRKPGWTLHRSKH